MTVPKWQPVARIPYLAMVLKYYAAVSDVATIDCPFCWAAASQVYEHWFQEPYDTARVTTEHSFQRYETQRRMTGTGAPHGVQRF